MQLDESTDVSQCSLLLVFVPCVHLETQSTKEEFLFCDSFLGTTKATDVFSMKIFIIRHLHEFTSILEKILNIYINI